MEAKTLYMIGKCSATELYPSLLIQFYNQAFPQVYGPRAQSSYWCPDAWEQFSSAYSMALCMSFPECELQA